MTGPAAPTLVVKVPAGTQVLAEDKETVLADLTEVGQRIVFLRGGDGGFGNTHFKSSTNQAPRRPRLARRGDVGLAAPEADRRCRPRRPAERRQVDLPRRGVAGEAQDRRLDRTSIRLNSRH